MPVCEFCKKSFAQNEYAAKRGRIARYCSQKCRQAVCVRRNALGIYPGFRSNETLTRKELKRLLVYEPVTGEFRWRKTVNNHTALKGQRAGSPRPDGYRSIVVQKVHYLEHRLIWFYMTGQWPEKTIDHINGDRADNHWKNLRKATHSQNSRNAKVHADNKSGIKGVSYDKLRNKYVAQMRLGYFNTAEEAGEAYNRAAKFLFGKFHQPNK